MKNENKTRCLTVSSIYQPRTSIEDKNVPIINLIGLWVEKAGFKIGDKIAVDVEQNRLLIKKLLTHKTPAAGDAYGWFLL